MTNCHNCGLPQGSLLSTAGRTVQVKGTQNYGAQRTRTLTAWCCCEECATQARAISKYGPATFRWPITLAQFRGSEPEEKRRKKRAQPVLSQSAFEQKSAHENKRVAST